jgi:predicted nucleotidyltransferase
MTTITAITAVSDQIVHEFKPTQIILFGSHAYGQPRADSDVDLLVVMHHEGNNVYQAIDILQRISPAFAIDLLVRTPSEVVQRLALNDSFLREITTKGRVLYATSDA